MKGEKIRVLILRDASGESWQVGVPLALLRFLIIAFVVMVILTGVTITWLGSIAVRLQAAELLSHENRELHKQLGQVAQMHEELTRISEREKVLNALMQSFLDDPIKSVEQTQTAASEDFYTDAARSNFLGEYRSIIRQHQSNQHEGREPLRIPLVFPPIEDGKAILITTPGRGQKESSIRIFCPPESPVRSPLEGIVSEAGWTTESGWHIRLMNTSGFECELSELGEIEVEPGDLVERGSLVGRSQKVGGESSAFLQMTFSAHGLAIDPTFAMIR